MKKNGLNKLQNDVAIIVCISTVALFASCSSAPKRTMERTAIADAAYSRLDLANSELDKGDLISAQNDIDAAYKAALSIDNADLLTKVCLTKVTAATAATNEHSTAGEKLLSTTDAQSVLLEARKFAARSTEPETMGAICDLYGARLLVNSGKEKPSSESLSEAISICNEAEGKLGKQKQYLAYLFRTRGEAYALQKNYVAAEKEFLNAVDLHTKERYLADIALDWYLVAKAYAADGKKTEALAALQNALKYDRLDENTPGIGADYYGMAAVLLKGKPTAEERAQAIEYAEYSANVYAAGGFNELAVKSLELLQK